MEKYKWNLKDIYENYEKAYSDLEKAYEISCEIKKYQGKLGNLEDYLEVHRLEIKLDEILEKVGAYTMLNSSLDMKSDIIEKENMKIYMLWDKISDNLIFIGNEINSLDEEYIKSLLEVEELKNYKRSIEDILITKKYRLTDAEEELLIKLSRGHRNI